ncbi:MAG: hypothetical protein J3R72DRAFT_430003 [Linnemannia gamsii]|nr:MAG: hypothetical protein J3R72DRAFT_430003 [Linnemannia gamsii]
MARPAMTFRPEDLEEDAPPPYAPTAPDTDSTVPDPEQHRQSYPALDTSYIVQQQQQQQQLQQQLQVGLPTTPPPPIHYYPAMSSSTSTTSIVAPPPLHAAPAAYPQYPAMSVPGVSGAYPAYPGIVSQPAYHAPLGYPVMGGSLPLSLPNLAGLPAAVPGMSPHTGGAYPLPYPSTTGMPPSHASSQHYSPYYTASYYAPPPGPPPPPTATGAGAGIAAAGTITPPTASTHLASSSPSHIVAPPPLTHHQQQQQQQQHSVHVLSTPNVAPTTTVPTAPEENLIDLDDMNGRWEPESPRAPHVNSSPVLQPMSNFAVLSPTPAAAPVQYAPPPPPIALPDLVTLYKCKKCGATLDSDTAVCKRIHVSVLSGERQFNQATEADLNERRKLILTGNSAANGSSSTVGSSVSQASNSSTEIAHDLNHGTSEVYLNHRSHNRTRRSEELPAGAIVSPPVLTEYGTSSSSTSASGALGRATSMVNPPSTHQYYTAPSTNDNHGTNDTYIRRSFSTQNPVTSFKKLWKDTKKEFSSVQQPSYSSGHHELVAPPPLPHMQPQQQQPYPQPGQYHQHPQGMYHSAPLPYVQLGYPMLSSSLAQTTASTSSTNPFDDPAPAPTPAYNPAHAPLYIPGLPTQQQQSSLPTPSAPPGHPW